MHKMWAVMAICNYMIPNAIAQTGRVPVRLEEAVKKDGIIKDHPANWKTQAEAQKT